MVARYICRDPLLKQSLWEHVQKRGPGSLWECGRCCPDADESPETEIILRVVALWSGDNTDLIVERNSAEPIHTTRQHIINYALHFLLDTKREWIAEEMKEKECRVYRFPESYTYREEEK